MNQPGPFIRVDTFLGEPVFAIECELHYGAKTAKLRLPIDGQSGKPAASALKQDFEELAAAIKSAAGRPDGIRVP